MAEQATFLPTPSLVISLLFKHRWVNRRTNSEWVSIHTLSLSRLLSVRSSRRRLVR